MRNTIEGLLWATILVFSVSPYLIAIGLITYILTTGV